MDDDELFKKRYMIVDGKRIPHYELFYTREEYLRDLKKWLIGIEPAEDIHISSY